MLTCPLFLITIAPDMKTQLNTSPIFTQGIESSQVSNMDMDLEGMKQACQIFRDNIYTDKILAVVREWVSNAVDEHLKHGIENPVQTGVKEGRFFVRDFANGLDDNGIRNVFGKYFRSTKSNSDQPIGGFGVGAKAGHCYQDVFYVTSFYNGTKTVYSCVLGGDESGASIGQVVEMSQEPTTESGLLVEIDIKEDRSNHGDTGTFLVYAQTMAATATLAKVEVVDDSGHSHVIKEIKKTLILEKDGIRFYSFEDKPESFFGRHYAITMGGVKYNTPDSFSEFAFEKNCSPQTFIQIDVPVGFFEVPISREFFRETAKFTNGIAKCEAILGEFINQQKQSLGDLPLSELCFNKKNQSQFFKFKNSAFVHAKVAMSLVKVGVSGDESHPALDHKGRKFVAIVSNSHYHRCDQVEKLKKWCADNSKTAFFVTKDCMEHICAAIAHHQVDSDLVFRPVSSLYPKQKGGGYTDGKFSVYRRGYGSSFRASALELHNRYWGVDHSVDDAKDFLAELAQSDSLSQFKKIVMYANGFENSYSFSSVSLKKDLATLGYLKYDDNATKDTLNKLYEISGKAQSARSALHSRFTACKNLLTDKTRNILLHRINQDVYNPKLSKTMDCIEKIVEELKNNKNELVSTFTNLALKSYYFQPCRSDVRKFIKASK